MRIKSELKVDGDEVQMTDENTYMLYNSIEENFRRRSDSVGCSVAVVPCFYKLLDDKQSLNDAPKLDGLVSYLNYNLCIMNCTKLLFISLLTVNIIEFSLASFSVTKQYIFLFYSTY